LTASSTARSAPRLEPKRLIHVQLPLGILEQVDARVARGFLASDADREDTDALGTATMRAIEHAISQPAQSVAMPSRTAEQDWHEQNLPIYAAQRVLERR
jgi:hypothetical protein